MILGGPGPTESCRDSGENVVFTNSPNHEKALKIDSKSIYFGGPWDTKITKREKMNQGKYMKKHTPENTEKSQKQTQMSSQNRPKIDKKSTFGAVPASRVAKHGFWGSGVDFQVSGGTPEGEN